MRAATPRARRGRGAVGPHRACCTTSTTSAIPTSRPATRACDGRARAARRPARGRRARSPRTPTSSASRATRRWSKTLFAVDELSGFVTRLRLRAPRGHPRDDAEVGQEEAQDAERSPPPSTATRSARARRSSAWTSTSTSPSSSPRSRRTRTSSGCTAPPRRARRCRGPYLDVGRRRYRASCARPHVAPLLLAALIARLPIVMSASAIVLFLRAETGSYAPAGVVAAAFALGAGGAAPCRGGWSTASATALSRPAAGAERDGVRGLCLLGARPAAPRRRCSPLRAGRGAAIPPISSLDPHAVAGLTARDAGPDPDGVRAGRRPDRVRLHRRPAARRRDRRAGRAGLAARARGRRCSWRGGAAFLASEPSRAWRPREHRSTAGLLGALRSPGIRTLVLTTLPFGFCFGAMEVDAARLRRGRGPRGAAGLLLAVWSLASAGGGLLVRRPPAATGA